jgi:hypothetical protein
VLVFLAMVERRRRKVFVTLNSEYFCTDGICVAVRNRHTGAFLPEHAALGMRFTGAFERSRDGGFASVEPPESTRPGQQLCFSSGHGDLEHDVLTSALLAIERPPKEVVVQYEG